MLRNVWSNLCHPVTNFKEIVLTMKYFIFGLCLFISISSVGLAQTNSATQAIDHTGRFYIYWGWNHSAYSHSDIRFKGENYDFTLKDVKANDRQTPFSLNPYFNPGRMSIPQYNLRIGYFFNEHYNVSIGSDHMKYVMQADQMVKISGKIDGSNSPYDATYANDDIRLTTDFLQFEHTDGLNYLNIEIRRQDNIFNYKKIDISWIGGFGLGVLVPRTNTTLLNNPRYDEFHLAGYGLSGVLGINVLFYKYFFVQSEFKEGFINMPDIRTTRSSSDKASQHFFFSQLNIVFGANIAF